MGSNLKQRTRTLYRFAYWTDRRAYGRAFRVGIREYILSGSKAE
jgi:hypothetical protein